MAAPVALINELPPELLPHVVSFCDYGESNCKRLLQLSCVCKHWRDILLAYPQFWTKLECLISTRLKNEPNSNVPPLIDHMERWFGRAGDLPRDLTLSFEYAGRKTFLLYEYLTKVSQWENLSFTLTVEGASNWNWLEGLLDAASAQSSPCWPNLKSFEIEAPATRYDTGRFTLPLQKVAPGLEVLKINVAELRLSIFELFKDSFSWTVLKHLDFNGLLNESPLPFLLHVLESAPNLEILKFIDRLSVTPTPKIRATAKLPILHTKLQHLALQDNPSSMVFLHNIRTPSLLSLDIARSYCPGPMGTPVPPGTPLTDTITSLVSSSSCTIKELRLKWTPLSDHDLFTLLKSVRSLEYIYLDEAACFWPAKPDTFFEKLKAAWVEEGQQVLPHLKTFSYNEGIRCRIVRKDDSDFDDFKRDPTQWWAGKKHRKNRQRD